MKNLIIPIITFSMFAFGCNSGLDTTMCKEHAKNCPISENCPEHPECEAHENCKKGVECPHKACMAYDKEMAAK